MSEQQRMPVSMDTPSTKAYDCIGDLWKPLKTSGDYEMRAYRAYERES